MENTFQTRDIRLASFLKSKNIRLVEIRAIDKFHSAFIFENSPQIDSLVSTYVSGAPLSDCRELINCYRHLVNDSRLKQNELVSEVSHDAR